MASSHYRRLYDKLLSRSVFVKKKKYSLIVCHHSHKWVLGTLFPINSSNNSKSKWICSKPHCFNAPHLPNIIVFIARYCAETSTCARGMQNLYPHLAGGLGMGKYIQTRRLGDVRSHIKFRHRSSTFFYLIVYQINLSTYRSKS